MLHDLQNFYMWNIIWDQHYIFNALFFNCEKNMETYRLDKAKPLDFSSYFKVCIEMYLLQKFSLQV